MKKKHMKKILALAVMTMVCVGLTGCGKDKTDKTKDTLAVVATEELEVTESSEEITEESTEETLETETLEESTAEVTEEATESSLEETDSSGEKTEEVTKETPQSQKETTAETKAETKEPVTETVQKEETNPQTQTPESKPVESKPAETPQAQAPAPAPTPAPTPEPTPAPEVQKPAEHVHSFVEEVTEATCDTGKVITTKCSTCGHVEGTRAEGSGLGHDYNDIITAQPTCFQDGYHNVVCKRCKATGEGHGTLPMLPHTYTTQVMVEGDCRSPKVTKDVCTVCGHEEPYKEDWNAHANDHKWISGTYPVWSDEAFAMVDVPRTCCEVCGMDKPQ